MALLPFFNKYPYTNLEQLNLDWMMEKIGGFDARITDNTEKITVLREDLTTETNDRIDADNELDLKIAAEAAARLAADNALSGDIANEATARAAADTALSDRITSEVDARTAADTAEAEARANADTTLQGNIDAEATARANADTALTNLINGKFTVVTITSDQGVWSITSDNQADLFDLTKNVMLYHDQAGVYYQRDGVEKHGSITQAKFSTFTAGTEDRTLTVEGETFSFNDLNYVGGTTFVITTNDDGETIINITYASINVDDTLELVCEDRLAIDKIGPVVIEVTANGQLLADGTTYSTSFDDWSSLMDANDIVVDIEDSFSNVIKAHAVNISPELIQFFLEDHEGDRYIMNIRTDATPVTMGVVAYRTVFHDDIWVSYDTTDQKWYVREGDVSLIVDEDIRTVLINNDDPTNVERYLVTRVGRNADGTGSKVYFGNYFCETDSVTNKAKLVYKQYIFEWNPNTDEYDITYDTFDIGSAT